MLRCLVESAIQLSRRSSALESAAFTSLVVRREDREELFASLVSDAALERNCLRVAASNPD